MLALKIDLKTPEIETRLIEFAVLILKIARELRKSGLKSLSRRLICSSASAALNYGDLPYGGTSVDLVITMNSVLRDLQQTYALLKIIRAHNYVDASTLNIAYQEVKQLIISVVRNMEDIHIS